MAVVAVGANSFLARSVKDFVSPEDWQFISRNEALNDLRALDKAQVVVNFAFSPSFKTSGYDPVQDIDSILAQKIAARPVHYIMLSSRTAYGEPPPDLCLRETLEPNPVNAYGKAKLAIERSLETILPPERLTILRLGNVFGIEPGRETFMGRAQTSLMHTGKITLDIDPSSVRDFLSAERFAAALAAIAKDPKPGLYNLGAGFPVSCGEVMQALIEGFGSGEIVQTGHGKTGQFWLEMSKTRETFNIPEITLAVLRGDITACGRLLKAMSA